jgi:hypothetical protein
VIRWEGEEVRRIESAPRSKSNEFVRTFIGAAREDAVVEWAAFSFGNSHQSASLDTPGPRELEHTPLLGALSFGEYSPASAHLGQFLTNLENERTKAMAHAGEERDAARAQDMARKAEARKQAIERFELVLSQVLGQRVDVRFQLEQQAPTLLFEGRPVPLEMLGEGLRRTVSWLSDLLTRCLIRPPASSILAPATR